MAEPSRQFKKRLSFDRWNGKAFRIAQTPSGAARSQTGEVLSDDPDRWSIVTPENGEAFNWPAARDDLQVLAKQRWNKIQDDGGSQYKMDQIRRSIVSNAKGGESNG
jgi:hypothetical protein